MTRRAFLVGYYGAGNLGDEAIREAIERAARARGWVIQDVAVRRDGRDPQGVRLRRRPLRYLRAIARSRLVVIGGGGILKDEGLGLPLELFLTALLARLMRRPVAILAVGVGPFYSRLGRLLVKLTARLGTTRSVRDRDSQAALRAMGVESVLVADPVFAGTTTGVAREPDGKVLLISLRPWFHAPGHDPARMGRLLDALAAAVDAAGSAGWRVRVVSLYWPRDHDVARELARRTTTPLEVDGAPMVWQGLVGAVATASAVLAMRYHALAAAVVEGRPAVAIAYEPKVRELAREAGVPAIDPASGSVEADLPAAVDALLADAGERLGSASTVTATSAVPRVDALRAAAETGLDLAFGKVAP